MISRYYSPSPPHRANIECYAYYSIDEDEIPCDGIRCVPTGCPALVFNGADEFYVYNETYPDGIRQHGNLIVGQQQRYYTMVPAGRFHHVSVLFTPVGLYNLFGIHIDCLVNNAAPLDAFIPSLAQQTHSIFHTPKTVHNPQSCIACFEDLLSVHCRYSQDGTGALINRAVKDIVSTKGIISVGILARNASMSIRNFRRIFLKVVGLSPKAYIRLIRMQHILRQLKHSDFSMQQWCRIALDFGFYDQTHFIKEFKRFCGMSPGAYLCHIKDDTHSFERFLVAPSSLHSG